MRKITYLESCLKHTASTFLLFLNSTEIEIRLKRFKDQSGTAMARCPPNSHAFRVAGSGKILITQFILIGRAFMAQECLYDSTLGIVLAPHELREFLFTSIQILMVNYKKTFSIDTIRIIDCKDK